MRPSTNLIRPLFGSSSTVPSISLEPFRARISSRTCFRRSASCFELLGAVLGIEDYIDHVDGATLVYSTVTEHREHLGGEVKIGRFLAGVADVTDRSKLRGELARLGHPVAEAHLLEEFDAEEVRR